MQVCGSNKDNDHRQGQEDEEEEEDEDVSRKIPAVVRRTLQENKFPLLHLLLLWKNLR